MSRKYSGLYRAQKLPRMVQKIGTALAIISILVLLGMIAYVYFNPK